MLQITVPAFEGWDEKKSEFVYGKEQTLKLEHSLLSLSKWEAKWQKPFLTKTEKTNEEELDYIRCMTIGQPCDPDVYDRISYENLRQIAEYINSPMTATTFSEDDRTKPSREIMTSEVIYCAMIQNNIPVEFEKWHLNRLLTLIRVCAIKNSPSKKMSNRDIMSRNAALNASRRKKLGTRG